MSYLASDVLSVILGSLSVEKFSGDPEKIHSTLALVKRHYPILDVFSFTSGDVYPFSRDLEDSLNILQRSGMISMANPDYDTFIVNTNGRKIGSQLASTLFNESEQKQLREISHIFQEECGIVELSSSRVTEPADNEAVAA